VVLILLFGFGLSLDVKNVPVAVVMGQDSAEAHALAAGFQLSPYFQTRVVRDFRSAQDLMQARQVDGIVRIPSDFARRVQRGDAQVQLVVHGSDANRARIIQGYAAGALERVQAKWPPVRLPGRAPARESGALPAGSAPGAWAARTAAEGASLSGLAPAPPGAVLQARLWFNEANDSRWFLVPGLLVLVMTLIGALLTSMVVAREWERGTLEALFVTPVRSDEILIGKTVPYFVLAMAGLLLCMVSAKFLFHVPIRGSVWVLWGVSVLYILVALGIGLLISSAVRSQLVASQLTMLATFMPAFMLSGFLFDLRSMPAAVRLITYLLPARYYVSLLQTAFLAGDVWSVILPNSAVLAAMAVLLFAGSRAVGRKRLT